MATARVGESFSQRQDSKQADGATNLETTREEKGKQKEKILIIEGAKEIW